MQQAKATIQNEIGLHARPAAQFVKEAKQFNSTITIACHGKTVNAKSLVLVLGLAVRKDDEIELSAEGTDENEAIASLTDFINNKLAKA
jgi:phosphocarrier protein HPr